jgi:hypothetical protein
MVPMRQICFVTRLSLPDSPSIARRSMPCFSV